MRRLQAWTVGINLALLLLVLLLMTQLPISGVNPEPWSLQNLVRTHYEVSGLRPGRLGAIMLIFFWAPLAICAVAGARWQRNARSGPEGVLLLAAFCGAFGAWFLQAELLWQAGNRDGQFSVGLRYAYAFTLAGITLALFAAARALFTRQRLRSPCLAAFAVFGPGAYCLWSHVGVFAPQFLQPIEAEDRVQLAVLERRDDYDYAPRRGHILEVRGQGEELWLRVGDMEKGAHGRIGDMEEEAHSWEAGLATWFQENLPPLMDPPGEWQERRIFFVLADADCKAEDVIHVAQACIAHGALRVAFGFRRGSPGPIEALALAATPFMFSEQGYLGEWEGPQIATRIEVEVAASATPPGFELRVAGQPLSERDSWRPRKGTYSPILRLPPDMRWEVALRAIDFYEVGLHPTELGLLP